MTLTLQDREYLHRERTEHRNLVNELTRQRDEARAELAKLRDQTRWRIVANEGLPPMHDCPYQYWRSESDEVLVALTNWWVVRATRQDHGRGDWQNIHWQTGSPSISFDDEMVMAWMPLPAHPFPYKEEDDS